MVRSDSGGLGERRGVKRNSPGLGMHGMGREEIVFAAFFFHSTYSQVHGRGKLGVKLSFTTCKEMN